MKLTAALTPALILAALLVPADLVGQTTPVRMNTGPIIHSAGPTFGVSDPSFVMPADHEYRVVWEIKEGAGEPTGVDPEFTTMARFFNLHGRHGVDPERIHLAAVVHGAGWHALLSDEAYAERFDGLANPSRELIQELLANGTEIVLCGQTAGSRGVEQSELLPGVKMGLSAMTALHWFQSQGYTFNPW